MKIVGSALILFCLINQAREVLLLNQLIKGKEKLDNGLFFSHSEWATAGELKIKIVRKVPSFIQHSTGGPSKWNLTFPDCGLNAQSPINIQRSSVIKKRASLLMNYYDKEVISVKASQKNKNHS